MKLKVLAFLKQLWTEADNETADWAKVHASGITAYAMFLQGWDVLHNHIAFNFLQFGSGVGGLAAGIGVLFKLKKETGAAPDPVSPVKADVAIVNQEKQ